MNLCSFVLITLFCLVSYSNGQMRRRDIEKLGGKSEDTKRLEAAGPLTACRFAPVIGRCPDSDMAMQEDKYFWVPDKNTCVRFEPGMCDSSGKNQFMSWQDCNRACDPNNQALPQRSANQYQWNPLSTAMGHIMPMLARGQYGGYYGRGNYGYGSGYGNLGNALMYGALSSAGYNNYRRPYYYNYQQPYNRQPYNQQQQYNNQQPYNRQPYNQQAYNHQQPYSNQQPYRNQQPYNQQASNRQPYSNQQPYNNRTPTNVQRRNGRRGQSNP